MVFLNFTTVELLTAMSINRRTRVLVLGTTSLRARLFLTQDSVRSEETLALGTTENAVTHNTLLFNDLATYKKDVERGGFFYLGS